MTQVNDVLDDLKKYTAQGNSSGAAVVLCTHPDSLYYSLRSLATSQRAAKKVLLETKETLCVTPQDLDGENARVTLDTIGRGRLALLKLSLRLHSDVSGDIYRDIHTYDRALRRFIAARVLVCRYVIRTVFYSVPITPR